VTPSAWALSGSSAFQVKNAALAGYANNAYLTANAYFTSAGGLNYIANGFASYYSQVSGVHAWFSAASGSAGTNLGSLTQAMTLDASGNLGIGTTSPGVRLDVIGTQNISGAASGSATGTLIVKGAQSNSNGLSLTQNSGTDTSSIFNFYSGPLLFGTNNTERARIDSSGNLLVGTTAQISGSTSRLVVDYATADYVATFRNSNATPYGLLVRHDTDKNNAGSDFLYCVGAGTVRAEIRSNGGIANYQANDVNLSDRREKTNFAPAGEYLSKICAIPVQTFNYIDQNLEEDAGLTLGVVAQDVQAVAPELVSESNWGTEEEPKMRLSIYQTDLQYALMKALQEAVAEINLLKARLDAANL